MSAVFVASSSRRLLNSAPPTIAAPFTLAMWVYPAQTAAQQVVWQARNQAANHLFALNVSGTSAFQLSTNDGGSSLNTNAGTYTANTWNFVVCRWISTTNRRIAVLQADGVPAHAQTTTLKNPNTPNVISIGSTGQGTPGAYLDGRIAEWWYVNADIQEDGAQLQDSTLRTLAFRGPFALPHIRDDIIEYRRFKSCGLDSRSDRYDEVYWNPKFGRQTWTNTNGVTIGPHCPAANRYRWTRSRSGIVVPV